MCRVSSFTSDAEVKSDQTLIVFVLMTQIADTMASTPQAVQGSAANPQSVTLNLPQKS